MKHTIETLEIERLMEINRNFELMQSRGLTQYNEHDFKETRARIREVKSVILMLK